MHIINKNINSLIKYSYIYEHFMHIYVVTLRQSIYYICMFTIMMYALAKSDVRFVDV